MDCIEVCPVDCFYEGKNMLVIKPEECIDCGVCEPECPVDAIVADTESGSEKWLELNTKYSEIWPNITIKKDPPKDNKKNKNINHEMQVQCNAMHSTVQCSTVQYSDSDSTV